MIDKQFTKKLLQAISRRSQGVTDHHLMHPEREWFIGLGVALLCLIGGILWAISLYSRYSVVSTDQVVEVSIPTVYREGEVNQALDELKAREAKTEQLKQLLESSKTSPFIQKDPVLLETEELASATSSNDILVEPVVPAEIPPPTSTSTPVLEMAL